MCMRPSTVRWELSSEHGAVREVLYTCADHGLEMGPMVRAAGWAPSDPPQCGTRYAFTPQDPPLDS